MSIMAAQRLGLRCLSLDSDPDSPAGQIADSVVGDIRSPEDIAKVLKACQTVTLENEFVPAIALQDALLEAGREPKCLTPSVETMAVINDKLEQRKVYVQQGVPTPVAMPIEAGPPKSFPCIAKQRFGGYDGKGTRTLNSKADFDVLLSQVKPGTWLVEDFIEFRREIAVMVARPCLGSPVCFPTMETVQSGHVCDIVFPAESDASETALRAVEAIGGFGLFGVELFETTDGQTVVNEVAPRPHNSGHYTLDWGAVSQFEQHVRLVMGWPLGPVNGRPSAMANILGPVSDGNLYMATKAALSTSDDVFVHWYGKPWRPGRKLGHINATGTECRHHAEAARLRFLSSWSSASTL